MGIREIFFIFSLAVFVGVFLYIIYNLLKKVEKCEDIIATQDVILDNLKKAVIEASTKLKEHDTRGHYNSDDDLGYYFKTLLEVDKVITDYINESNTEQKE
jgi:hypothetical protein